MKTRIVQFIPVLVTLLVIVFRYFSQWCIGIDHTCFRTFLDRIYLFVINPLFYFAVFFLPAAIILTFTSREIFKSWFKFARFAIPLFIIFVILIPDSSPNTYMDFFPFYRDDAARLAGAVFAGASFVLIIWKWFSARRDTN